MRPQQADGVRRRRRREGRGEGGGRIKGKLMGTD
jgi:hypothetical protein